MNYPTSLAVTAGLVRGLPPDRTISPELQRFMAWRMDATTVEIDSGHLSLVTHPEEVTALIMNAVQAVRSSATADATAQPI